MNARVLALFALTLASSSWGETITFDDLLPPQFMANDSGSLDTQGFAFTPTRGNENGWILGGSYQPAGNPQGNQPFANNGTPNLLCGNWVNLRVTAAGGSEFDLLSLEIGGTVDQEIAHRWAWASAVNIVGHRAGGAEDLTFRYEMDSEFALRQVTLNWTDLTSVDFLPEHSLEGNGPNDYEFTLDSLVVTAHDVCSADYTRDGGVDGDDVIAFFADWDAGVLGADFNADGGVDGDDVIGFFERWDAGC